MEEETYEHYGRCIKLLQTCRTVSICTVASHVCMPLACLFACLHGSHAHMLCAQMTDTSTFMLAVWRSLLLCPSSRLAAVNFISVTLPKHATDYAHYLPPRTLLIASLIATLHDTNILAQRRILELMTTHFTLQHAAVWTGDEEQLMGMVEGAMDVVLRHDVSLTRRFYMWLIPNANMGQVCEHVLHMVRCLYAYHASRVIRMCACACVRVYDTNTCTAAP